jgi:hypothetical protein
LVSHIREENRLRVCENRVLRRIFVPKREELAGGWRTLHNEYLHKLYSSPNVIRVMKSRRIRWAGHVARIGEMKREYIFGFENVKGRDQLKS